MATRIFMTGESGDHNLGDEGQALASACRLRRYFPDAHIVSTGIDPLGAILRHQTQVVPWPMSPWELDHSRAQKVTRRIAQKLGANEDFLDPAGRRMEAIFDEQYRRNAQFRSVVEHVKQADFVFDMGHGALNDVFDPFMICFLYYLAGRFGKPLFVSGQSIGPLWRPRSIKMVRDTLAHAHTVGLRDKDVSYQVLVEQVGVDANRVRLVEIGDDTLDLVAKEPAWEAFPPCLADILQSGEFFAVQWRSSDYTQAVTSTAQIVPLAEAIQCLHEATRLPAVFMAFSWELGSSDVLAATRLYNYLQGRVPFYVVWNYQEATELKWLLGRARFGIGLSYHFHVFLLTQGVPPIGLSTNAYYDIKLRGAYTAYGHKLAPLSYPQGLCNTQAFQVAIETVTGWTEADRQRLTIAADGMRDSWHRAFQTFLRDERLMA